ncbi:hypothetical protein EYF80_027263 [Liparis tanakae]|uniref:Uncharacterized protein n=1 Tax=Liparis tanakae TaxID=230148 RepID=A0A4Z2HAL5_9TELE|nr:hypothetical protein EYF80_027263 [Liparis tanakae]
MKSERGVEGAWMLALGSLGGHGPDARRMNANAILCRLKLLQPLVCGQEVLLEVEVGEVEAVEEVGGKLLQAAAGQIYRNDNKTHTLSDGAASVFGFNPPAPPGTWTSRMCILPVWLCFTEDTMRQVPHRMTCRRVQRFTGSCSFPLRTL